jgi:hypothetical protein
MFVFFIYLFVYLFILFVSLNIITISSFIVALCEPPTSEDYAQGLIKKQLIKAIDMDIWKVNLFLLKINF